MDETRLWEKNQVTINGEGGGQQRRRQKSRAIRREGCGLSTLSLLPTLRSTFHHLLPSFLRHRLAYSHPSWINEVSIAVIMRCQGEWEESLERPARTCSTSSGIRRLFTFWDEPLLPSRNYEYSFTHTQPTSSRSSSQSLVKKRRAVRLRVVLCS